MRGLTSRSARTSVVAVAAFAALLTWAPTSDASTIPNTIPHGSTTVIDSPSRPELVAPDLPDYLVIGSSMASILELPAGAAGARLLDSRHSVIIDARGCRTLIIPSCHIGDRPAPPNALDTLRSHAGGFDAGIVISVGANDPTDGATGIEAAIHAILDEASRQNIPWVVWLTYREKSSVGSSMRAHNAVLRRVAATEPRLLLADWNSLADTLPASSISGDGIHLGPTSALALAGLIADALDIVAMSGPGNTDCSLGRVPRRSGGAAWSAVAPSVGRVRASGSAARLQLRCP